MTTLLRRGWLVALAAMVLLAIPTPGSGPLVAQSSENSRYAAIVLDAETGEVLFARHADAPRYPASITKVMTLYLVFDALEQGKIRLTDVITVSPRAASQPPSKLGLAAGQTITVDDAIRSLAVRSANDMAVSLAEHVAGSEARFTALMTLKARDIGMTHSRFVTANGLPDSRQLTTVRDLAVLSRAVMRDFPQYYHYFGQQHWYYNGRQYNNTNGLLHQNLGYDGIKTGFTNASGYNLAASSVRDGRRLITVVLGGRSSQSRNAHVAELMNTGFEVERLRGQGQVIQVAQTFFEQRGFGIDSRPAPVQYAALGSTITPPVEGRGDESDTEVSYASVAARGPAPTEMPAAAVFSAPAAPVPAPAPAPTMVQAQAPAPPAAPTRAQPRSNDSVTALLNGGTRMAEFAPPEPRPSPRAANRTPAPRATPAAPAGRWSVQVGAFRQEADARNWLTEVNRRFRSQFTGAESRVQTASGWYRSRFTGMTEAAARAACAALGERRVTCLVVQPD